MMFQEFFLPGVDKWDGLPFHNFRRIWWVALCAALGTISQDAWSLLQTARDQDLGGPSNAGTAAQTVQSQNRNQRLFGAILNYIDATSYIYRYVSANFANNGRGLFNYLYEYGHLAYTSEQRVALETDWTEATMAKVGIKFKANAVFKWAEYVQDLGEKLNKSERDKRVKYLAGFPESFDVMVVPERATGAVGNYTHPVNYPAYHPQAGNAHPYAGQPDIIATAHAFYIEWSRMVTKGLIKAVPKGNVYQTTTYDQCQDADPDSDCDSDMDSANMARARVDSRTVCGVCGGIGHAGNVDGVGQCLTTRLSHKVPSNVLSGIGYPSGYSAPKFFSSFTSRPSSSSSHRPSPSSSYQSRPPPRHAPPPRARTAEREYSPENSDFQSETDETAERAQPDKNRSDKAEKSRYSNSSRTHKPRPHASRRPKPKARMADSEPSSSAAPAELPRTAESSESDVDEHHSRLAVAFDNVVFP